MQIITTMCYRKGGKQGVVMKARARGIQQPGGQERHPEGKLRSER